MPQSISDRVYALIFNGITAASSTAPDERDWLRLTERERIAEAVFAELRAGNIEFRLGPLAELAEALNPEPKCRHCPALAASPTAETCSCCCHRAVGEAERWREMSRADRRRNMCLDSMACDDGSDHGWIPVSFRFETQLLDGHGRVSIRQPDLKQGRVYMVCMACRTHTYIDTEWAGYYLGGPDYGPLEPGYDDPAETTEDR